MIWLVYAIIVWGLAILLVRPIKIKQYWKAGLVSLAVTLFVDSNALALELYTFHKQWINIGGLPIFYLLASIPLGIMVVCFVPIKRKNQLLYVVWVALALTVIQFIMLSYDAISYQNWGLIFSFEIYMVVVVLILTLNQMFHLWSIWRM